MLLTRVHQLCCAGGADWLQLLDEQVEVVVGNADGAGGLGLVLARVSCRPATQVARLLDQGVDQVVREKAPDAVTRVAEILSAKAGKICTPPVTDYLGTVGKTPLVKINRILPPECKAARVLLKLEMQNPGGSLKDRIALNMIEAAEKAGKIKPGVSTLIDFTSGNTGIGESMICAAKGYKCIIAMPQVPPMYERYLICRQFGADVHLLNPAAGAKAWFAYMETLAAKPDHWYINQIENTDNPSAHVTNTGPEIWAQTEGKIDTFIHGIGTGGCIQGVGSFLKSKKPDCKIIALEPTEARVHVGQPMGKHGIVGWAPGIHSTFIEGAKWEKEKLNDQPRGVVDEWGSVVTPDAVKMAMKMAATEGIMVGPSAGASIHYAMEVACRPDQAGKTIVVVVPSHAIRYTAHPLWGKVKEETVKALPNPPLGDKEAPILQWDSANPS